MDLPQSLRPLLSRLLSDEQFRRQFLEDPLKSAAELGCALNEEEIALLRTSSETESAGEPAEERISPSACMVVPWGLPPGP